jgi:hypothetical protein
MGVARTKNDSVASSAFWEAKIGTYLRALKAGIGGDEM